MKPIKPYPDFPLTPHVKGWVKKYKGKVRFVCGPLPPVEALKTLGDKLREWAREDNGDGHRSARPPGQSHLRLLI